jgi:pyruvate/2-oxoacid:ferredoxin oxidoreductase beta subunit
MKEPSCCRVAVVSRCFVSRPWSISVSMNWALDDHERPISVASGFVAA